MQGLKYFVSFKNRNEHRILLQVSILSLLLVANLLVSPSSAQTRDDIDDTENSIIAQPVTKSDLQKEEKDVKKPFTPTNVCTPTMTVTEGDLFPGGPDSFNLSGGPGTITIKHINAGTGLQSLTVVNSSGNSAVNIPDFTSGTYEPVVVNFNQIISGYAMEFSLRVASTYHAANIRVRCSETCTPLITITEGDLLPGGIIYFNAMGGPGRLWVDPIDAGLGIKVLTLVGEPFNAIVNVLPFEPGTFSPVEVEFAVIDPNMPVDFRMRAASTYYAANIRVRCAAGNQ